jgi:uncharacterized protein
MDILYDPKKNAANIKRHGVDFEDAQAMLLDPYALTWEDEDAEDEQRFLQLGMDAVGRVLVVVFTYRDDIIRLIAAWKANDKQRKRYEAGRL